MVRVGCKKGYVKRAHTRQLRPQSACRIPYSLRCQSVGHQNISITISGMLYCILSGQERITSWLFSSGGAWTSLEAYPDGSEAGTGWSSSTTYIAGTRSAQHKVDGVPNGECFNVRCRSCFRRLVPGPGHPATRRSAGQGSRPAAGGYLRALVVPAYTF